MARFLDSLFSLRLSGLRAALCVLLLVGATEGWAAEGKREAEDKELKELNYPTGLVSSEGFSWIEPWYWFSQASLALHSKTYDPIYWAEFPLNIDYLRYLADELSGQDARAMLTRYRGRDLNALYMTGIAQARLGDSAALYKTINSYLTIAGSDIRTRRYDGLKFMIIQFQAGDLLMNLEELGISPRPVLHSLSVFWKSSKNNQAAIYTALQKHNISVSSNRYKDTNNYSLREMIFRVKFYNLFYKYYIRMSSYNDNDHIKNNDFDAVSIFNDVINSDCGKYCGVQDVLSKILSIKLGYYESFLYEGYSSSAIFVHGIRKFPHENSASPMIYRRLSRIARAYARKSCEANAIGSRKDPYCQIFELEKQRKISQ